MIQQIAFLLTFGRAVCLNQRVFFIRNNIDSGKKWNQRSKRRPVAKDGAGCFRSEEDVQESNSSLHFFIYNKGFLVSTWKYWSL
jgi:hypothetical protein